MHLSMVLEDPFQARCGAHSSSILLSAGCHPEATVGGGVNFTTHECQMDLRCTFSAHAFDLNCCRAMQHEKRI